MYSASINRAHVCSRVPLRPVSSFSKPSSSARLQNLHTTGKPRQLLAWSAASLQTLTVDDPYEIEVSYLSAQIEVLSGIRNSVLRLDDVKQVRTTSMPGLQQYPATSASYVTGERYLTARRVCV